MTKEEYLNSDFVKMAHLNNQVVYLTQVNRRLEKEYVRLKAQIEKMKCCGNCKYKKGGVVKTCRKKKIYMLNKGCCEEWEPAE